MKRAYFDTNGQAVIDEIVLAGPGPMKELLQKVLPQELAKMVVKSVNVGRSGRPGLYDLTQILCGGKKQ